MGNFFTNYYFFLLLLFAVLPLRIFPPPSLKIESNSLYIQLFYERKKFLMKKLLLTMYDCLGATRVIFVLPLFAIPLLSCLYYHANSYFEGLLLCLRELPIR